MEGTLVIQIRGKRDRIKFKSMQLFSSKPATAYNLAGKGEERADFFFFKDVDKAFFKKSQS